MLSFFHKTYSNLVMYRKIVSQDCFLTRFNVKFDARNHLCKVEKRHKKLYLFFTRLFVKDYHRFDPRNLHYIVKNLASNMTQDSENQTRFINMNVPQDC